VGSIARVAGWVFIGICATAPVHANAPNERPVLPCSGDKAPLRTVLEAEYTFDQEAQSVRGGFLEGYPAAADISADGDLGFTAGPWVDTEKDGTQTSGHFLRIWKRDAQCRWQVEWEGEVKHGAPVIAEPKMPPDRSAHTKPDLPPPQFIVEDAPGHAINDFQVAAQQEGCAAALRTFGRNGDFHLYIDDEVPLDGLAEANEYLIAHPIAGGWKEEARGRSADSTIEYSAGRITDSHNQGTHAYIQIWQYDPKVANWGLRILLIARTTGVQKSPQK
jgi:hypothetical protein